jgi:3-hydroxybutyryl-CoA dehydrogenase
MRLLDRQIKKGTMTEGDRDAALAGSRPQPAMSALGDCDLVVEAATEDEGIKRKIFKELVENVKDDAIIASNTSSISITRLAPPPTGPSASSACTS